MNVEIYMRNKKIPQEKNYLPQICRRPCPHWDIQSRGRFQVHIVLDQQRERGEQRQGASFWLLLRLASLFRMFSAFLLERLISNDSHGSIYYIYLLSLSHMRHFQRSLDKCHVIQRTVRFLEIFLISVLYVLPQKLPVKDIIFKLYR